MKAAHQSQISEEPQEEDNQKTSAVFTYSTPPSVTKPGSSRGIQFDDEDEDDNLSTASSPREEEQGHIEVALLESVLLNGVTTSGVDDLEESGCYVVEYESGDD